MPTADQILAQPADPFTALEIEQVRAICNVPLYATVEALLAGVLSIQRQSIRALVSAFDAIGDGTIALEGGEDGVNYSQLRDKQELRTQLRIMLGLPPIDPSTDPKAAQIVSIQVPYYDAPDTEFG